MNNPIMLGHYGFMFITSADGRTVGTDVFIEWAEENEICFYALGFHPNHGYSWMQVTIDVSEVKLHFSALPPVEPTYSSAEVLYQ